MDHKALVQFNPCPNVETYSQNKHESLKETWYIFCQQTGAVTKVGRYATADVIANKSLKIMEAFKNSLGSKFYSRMENLQSKLPTGTDIQYKFSCK